MKISQIPQCIGFFKSIHEQFPRVTTTDAADVERQMHLMWGCGCCHEFLSSPRQAQWHCMAPADRRLRLVWSLGAVLQAASFASSTSL